jgi:hypothetical protein
VGGSSVIDIPEEVFASKMRNNLRDPWRIVVPSEFNRIEVGEGDQRRCLSGGEGCYNRHGEGGRKNLFFF